MPLKFKCYRCGKILSAPESSVGRRCRCKQCRAELVIPGPDADEERAESDLDSAEDLSFPTDFSRTAPADAPSSQRGKSSDPKRADRPDALGAPPMPRAPAAVPPTVSREPPRHVPSEPWYYNFLAGYAVLCMALGVIQFALVLLLWFGVQLSLEQRLASGITLLSGLAVMMSFLGMLSALLLSAPILLIVDMARNIRAMRYQ